jgi:hypothetical protein
VTHKGFYEDYGTITSLKHHLDMAKWSVIKSGDKWKECDFVTEVNVLDLVLKTNVSEEK